MLVNIKQSKETKVWARQKSMLEASALVLVVFKKNILNWLSWACFASSHGKKNPHSSDSSSGLRFLFTRSRDKNTNNYVESLRTQAETDPMYPAAVRQKTDFCDFWDTRLMTMLDTGLTPTNGMMINLVENLSWSLCKPSAPSSLLFDFQQIKLQPVKSQIFCTGLFDHVRLLHRCWFVFRKSKKV